MAPSRAPPVDEAIAANQHARKTTLIMAEQFSKFAAQSLDLSQPMNLSKRAFMESYSTVTQSLISKKRYADDELDSFDGDAAEPRLRTRNSTPSTMALVYCSRPDVNRSKHARENGTASWYVGGHRPAVHIRPC